MSDQHRMEKILHTVNSVVAMICVTVLATLRCLDINVALGSVLACAGLIPTTAIAQAWMNGIGVRRGDTARIEAAVTRAMKEK